MATVGRNITSLVGRLRWRLAVWLDWFYPRACWSDLATWAMRMSEWEDINWDTSTGTCALDIAENDGNCWCGKNRA